jgi:hypothetical protein
MNTRVLRIHQIDLNKINYLKIKDIGSKKQVYIDYEKSPLVFQCPSLLNENYPIKITDDYYELEIPLITQEKSKQNNFINFLKNIDSKIIQDANNNVNMWFKQNKMSYSYKTIVKDSDKYKNGTIKLKIIKTVNFESMIFLDNSKRIQIKDIPKDSWVKILLEIHSVIINNDNKTFYLFLRPHAFSFKEKQINLNYTFLDDSDSGDDILDSDTNNLFIKQSNNNSKYSLIEAQSSTQINCNLGKLDLSINPNFCPSSSEKESTDSEKEAEKEAEKESTELKKESTDSEKESTESDKESTESEKESTESDKKSTDSEKESTESDKECETLSETSATSVNDTCNKISNSDENNMQFENNFITFEKKNITTSLTSSTSSEETDNTSLIDSIILASKLQSN